MASIYDLDSGQAITAGLQGSSVCNEAINVAKNIAKERRRTVLLEDDDGDWLVGPSGRVRKSTPSYRQ